MHASASLQRRVARLWHRAREFVLAFASSFASSSLRFGKTGRLGHLAADAGASVPIVVYWLPSSRGAPPAPPCSTTFCSLLSIAFLYPHVVTAGCSRAVVLVKYGSCRVQYLPCLSSSRPLSSVPAGLPSSRNFVNLEVILRRPPLLWSQPYPHRRNLGRNW